MELTGSLVAGRGPLMPLDFLGFSGRGPVMPLDQPGLASSGPFLPLLFHPFSELGLVLRPSIGRALPELFGLGPSLGKLLGCSALQSCLLLPQLSLLRPLKRPLGKKEREQGYSRPKQWVGVRQKVDVTGHWYCRCPCRCRCCRLRRFISERRRERGKEG